MAKTVLLDVRCFAGGLDMTGVSNKIELSAEVETKPTTNYGSQGWAEVIGGLASSEIAGEGQWEAGTTDTLAVDDATWAQLGGTGAWSVSASNRAGPGELAYFTRAMRADYTLFADIGEVAPWTSSAKGSWPLVRGQFAHPPGTPRTAAGAGTALQLGPAPAGRRLYAALHVLSAAGTGPVLTVRVESAPDSGFAAPTTRVVFDPAAGPGGQILRTDGGPVTDAWWRLAWEITGDAPSFLFAAALGIG
ncbi:hypothetical protein AB0M23_30935 [Streptomyces sp. NPDC052077]|uniref:hypothetical protein n=1 Tax=Streptomyces sp. NPDC052077 TaxID=3154757 RepID=UPI00342E1059